MVCLGLEPGAAGWKAQINPLSYGDTPFSQFYTKHSSLFVCLNPYFYSIPCLYSQLGKCSHCVLFSLINVSSVKLKIKFQVLMFRSRGKFLWRSLCLSLTKYTTADTRQHTFSLSLSFDVGSYQRETIFAKANFVKCVK